MTRKIISISNLIIVIFLIVWNGFANTGNYNGKEIGKLSAEYSNLFTPASYAFSIWSLIFLMLVAFSIYGVYVSFSSKHQQKNKNYRMDFVQTTSPWFIAANVFCSLWVALWLDELVDVSVLMMLGILFCLLMCVRQLEMEIWDAPFPIIAFVWWPLCLYSGWISVAAIANFAAWFNSIYDFTLQAEMTITAIMIAVAFLINLFMLFKRNMREFALVGVWALVAIGVRHYSTDFHILAVECYVLAGLLFLSIAYHGSKNVKTNPFIKFQQWRKDS